MEDTIEPDEFLEIVQRLVGDDDGDHESVHGETDDLMESILTDLGYGAGIEIIKNSTRWYA
jgi:hypothetical protein